MEKVIELVTRIDEEKERLHELENAVSQAFEDAGAEDWPGEHLLIDAAQREIAKARVPLAEAENVLAQYIGTAEIEKAKAAAS